jgi:membrane dipeptidase
MRIDRRTMMAGSAALVAAPALAKARAAKGDWYGRAIIIDALGGVGDPYSPPEQLRLGDRAWAEMIATGVTLLRDTVMPVGNLADPWGDYQKTSTKRISSTPIPTG